MIPFPYQAAGAGLVGPPPSGGEDVTDPHFASVGYLLAGKGVEGGTTFVDSGPNNATVTRNGTTGGGITTSTSDYLFPASSIRGPWYSGNRLRLPDSPLFRGQGGPWTFECAIKRSASALGLSQVLMDGNNGSSNTTGPAIYITNGNTLAVWDGVAGANRGGGGSALPANVWLWVAVCWDGEVLRFYVDGELEQSVDTFSNTWGSAAPVALLGDQVGGQSFMGFAEQIRFTRVARYTGASYPVPSAPFPTA